jgi:hypothetical protein
VPASPRRALAALVLAGVSLLLLTASARGGTYLNTLEPTATLSGRQITVTVIYGCDAGQRVAVRVTATQRHVGAVAEGTRQATCSGDPQHLAVSLHTTGSLPFVPSSSARDDQPVEVCALAVTMTRGKPDDSHQWCKDLALVGS